MAKTKLGTRPKSFKAVVDFELLEGGTGSIECEYKYRTRTEFGAFLDAMKADAGVGDAPAEKEFSMAELMERGAGQSAKYLLEALDGWGLDEELNLANAQQLADELPAAVIAIMDKYRTACFSGRLGN